MWKKIKACLSFKVSRNWAEIYIRWLSISDSIESSTKSSQFQPKLWCTKNGDHICMFRLPNICSFHSKIATILYARACAWHNTTILSWSHTYSLCSVHPFIYGKNFTRDLFQLSCSKLYFRLSQNRKVVNLREYLVSFCWCIYLRYILQLIELKFTFKNSLI